MTCPTLTTLRATLDAVRYISSEANAELLERGSVLCAVSRMMVSRDDVPLYTQPVAAQGDRDKLLSIIASAYLIAGHHDAPAHILDVLADPEAATDAQVDAMLPYQPVAAQTGPYWACRECGYSGDAWKYSRDPESNIVDDVHCPECDSPDTGETVEVLIDLAGKVEGVAAQGEQDAARLDHLFHLWCVRPFIAPITTKDKWIASIDTAILAAKGGAQ